ncbi:hypothetical protein B0A48_12934 [Cryoendolithus antarcticus]|uniref:NACHT-NTPase and P-loop NTPases N-terminal domain-containing protein n=1 Tax=Cryoendolithus antarcticus TaxID=1507870 RepID=A0A1V8SQL3_9PEZI|nr:hypothetical protein B0A48_12934 [Cryoendolithus antarcticus]
MADPLSVVSAIASVIQLVDFSAKLFSRLNEYRSKSNELPASFTHIDRQLPILREILERSKLGIECESISDRGVKAIIPCLGGCGEKIEKLNDILAKIVPELQEIVIRKMVKGIRSVWKESEVRDIDGRIDGYVRTLSYYCAWLSSKLDSRNGFDGLDVKWTFWLNEAIKILTWLAYSERPLEIEELLEATGIFLDDVPRFDRDEILADPRDVLRICSSLVSMTTTVESNDRYSIERDHQHIVETDAEHSLTGDASDGSDNGHTLGVAGGGTLPDHVHAVGEEDNLSAYVPEPSADMNYTRSWRYGTALQAAFGEACIGAESRHMMEEIVEILLDHGADPDAHGIFGVYTSKGFRYYYTALQAAAGEGHGAVAQMLR